MESIRFNFANDQNFLRFLVNRMDMDIDGGHVYPYEYRIGDSRYILQMKYGERSLKFNGIFYEIPLFRVRQTGVSFYDYISALPFLNALSDDEMVKAMFNYINNIDNPEVNRRRQLRFRGIDVVDLSQRKKQNGHRQKTKKKSGRGKSSVRATRKIDNSG